MSGTFDIELESIGDNQKEVVSYLQQRFDVDADAVAAHVETGAVLVEGLSEQRAAKVRKALVRRGAEVSVVASGTEVTNTADPRPSTNDDEPEPVGDDEEPATHVVVGRLTGEGVGRVATVEALAVGDGSTVLASGPPSGDTYELDYVPPSRAGLTLGVRAIDADGETVAESTPIPDPSTKETADLTVDASPDPDPAAVGEQIFEFLTVRPPQAVEGSAAALSLDASAEFTEALDAKRAEGGRPAVLAHAADYVDSEAFVGGLDDLDPQLAAFVER